MKIKKVFALLSFLLSLNMLLNAQVFTDNEEIVFNSASLLSTNSSSSNDSLSWSEKKTSFCRVRRNARFQFVIVNME